MLAGQPVAPGLRVLGGVDDADEPGDRLLLQPLPGVPLVDPGHRGELAAGHGLV
jgi:hypothetical protein